MIKFNHFSDSDNYYYDYYSDSDEDVIDKSPYSQPTILDHLGRRYEQCTHQLTSYFINILLRFDFADILNK